LSAGAASAASDEKAYVAAGPLALGPERYDYSPFLVKIQFLSLFRRAKCFHS
jgi:hypothetical protein